MSDPDMMLDMTLSGIPTELIILIGQWLAPSDLNALAKTKGRFYQSLNPSLWQQKEDLALLWAAEHGKIECARKALAFGANINTEHPATAETLARPRVFLHREKLHNKSRASPLLLAAAAGQMEMVNLLVGVDGVDVNQQNDSDQTTPLMIAIIAEEEDVVRVLLADQNIDTDIKYKYVYGGSLMVASIVGNVNIVQQLLSHGKDPNKGNMISQCPLYLAAQSGHKDVVRVLLQAGAIPHPPDSRSTQATAWGNWYGNPFTHAIDKGPEMMKEFLKSPLFDIERVRDELTRAKCTALMKKKEEKFKYLFSIDCHDIDWHNGDGRTALFWAATYGQEEALKLLLAYDGYERVNCNTQTRGDISREDVLRLNRAGYAGFGEGVTPLISAARQGHIGAVRLILTADGIDIRHRDGIFGETALMAARSNGHLEVVQLLQTYTEE
ncbi:hypothetical protein N7533_005333 [Penicillium manginii]|uniref:uncharacterized protein n=1 Tax=Penicillium manginii TaxID=203109 RepID=UPI002548EC28|nr:uncharacterized protein N7533_005333 [Penicillium manginii]KAJ5755790.1 hypothetical protein N7533_005333 [Penicillium manginii]